MIRSCEKKAGHGRIWLTVSPFPKLVVVKCVSVANTTTGAFGGISVGFLKHKEFTALTPISGVIVPLLIFA